MLCLKCNSKSRFRHPLNCSGIINCYASVMVRDVEKIDFCFQNFGGSDPASARPQWLHVELAGASSRSDVTGGACISVRPEMVGCALFLAAFLKCLSQSIFSLTLFLLSHPQLLQRMVTRYFNCSTTLGAHRKLHQFFILLIMHLFSFSLHIFPEDLVIKHVQMSTTK